MSRGFTGFVHLKRRLNAALLGIGGTPFTRLMVRKWFMNKTVLALMGALFLAACSPGTYTSDGLASKSGGPDGLASFAFSVESCEDEARGHFSLSDEEWRIPVELSGHVMDFREPIEFGEDCSFYAQLEYVSGNPDYPGEGNAVVCFGGEMELSSAEVFSQVRVSVQSGPYAAYEHDGPIYGNIQSQACDS